ncbi:Gfo/Idh/MocA family oxidoreductase [Chitinimonas sp.]|uniref:Gfo/Idh/MocA family protein n=1 Tax=Chitinimonas sp. TaxID=1934313 RepID=UPI002F9254FE
MKAGLVGCGRIGCEFDEDADRVGIYTHAAAYRAAEGVALWAIADADPAKLANCGERYGIPPERRYTDAAQMLAKEPLDLLSIAAPDRLHAPLAKLAATAPRLRGLLLEKPLALDLDEGRAVLNQLQARGLAVVVNYSRRFCPAHAKLKTALAEGRLGRIQQVSGYYGKGVKHNGGHWLDLLRYLLGPLVSVQAWPSQASDYEGDPTPDLRITLAGGVTASLLGTDHLHYSLFEMDIVAEQGRVRITESGHCIAWYAAAESPYYAGYRLPVLTDTDTSGMRDLLLGAVENLRDTVLERTASRCDAEDGLLALCAADAACRSMLSGKPEPVV